MKDLYKKVFMVIILPVLPAGWIYIYIGWSDGWGYRHILALFSYTLCLGISYGVVQGIDKLRKKLERNRKSLLRRIRILRSVFYVGMLLGITRFSLLPLLRLADEESYMRIQYTIHSSIFSCIAVLLLGAYLLSELSRARRFPVAEINRGLSSLGFRDKCRRYGSILVLILIVLLLSWFLRPVIRILRHPHQEYFALLEEEIRDLENQGIPLTVKELNLSEIPDGENGALVFREVFLLMDELAGKYPDEWNYMPYVSPRDWENLPEEERKRVADIILHNREFSRIYELTEKAVNMRQRFYPERYYENSRMIEEKLFPEMVPEMAKFRALQRVLMSKAKLEAEYGDVDEAFAAILLGLKTARAASTDVPVLLTQLMRVTLLHISLAALDEISGLDGVSAESCRGIISRIEKERGELLIYPALKNGIFLTDIQKYTHHITDIKRITDPGKWARREAERISPPHATEGQLESMIAFFEKMAEQTMEEIRNIYPGVTSGEIAVLGKYPEKLQLVFLRTRRRVMSIMKEPNQDALVKLRELEKELKESPSIENAVVLLSLSNIIRVCQSEILSRAYLGAVKIGMANMLYHMEHDEYVGALSQLVPEFLLSLPPDPFTGCDYIYRREDEGFIVYSVGPSQRDDGGVHSPAGGDIVWEVD